MSKRKNESQGGLVYSTNPDFTWQPENETIETLANVSQKLRVHVETKHRGGKVATIITGFVGQESDLIQLGKLLKNKCGTGGSVKDGEIIIQGNCKEKIVEVLKKEGYSNTK